MLRLSYQASQPPTPIAATIMIPTKTSTIGLFLRSYYEIGDVPVDGMFFGESAFAPILMLYVLDDHVAPVCAATAFHPASFGAITNIHGC